MDFSIKRTLLSVSLLLLLLVSCGGGKNGGSTNDEVTNNIPTETEVPPSPVEEGILSVSSHSVNPGEVFTLSHKSILADKKLEAVVEWGGDSFTIPVTPLVDGSLKITLPPLINSSSGELSSGEVRLSIKGISSSVTVMVEPLLTFSSEVQSGLALTLVINATIENYTTVLKQLADITKETGSVIDTSEAQKSVEEFVAQLGKMGNEIAQTGGLTLEMKDGSQVVLGVKEISILDRLLTAGLQGVSSALNDKTTKAMKVSTAPGMARVLKPVEVNEKELRALIAKIQVEAGGNMRGLGYESFNIFLSLLGLPGNAIGKFGTKLGLAISAGEVFTVWYHGSSVTVGLTANALNGDRIKQEEMNASGERWANFGIATLAVIGGGVIAPGVALTASMFSVVIAVVQYNVADLHNSDMKIHIPDNGVEFSEIRVHKVGTFSFPEFEINTDENFTHRVNPTMQAKNMDLEVYGIQEYQSWNPSAWSALSIAHRSSLGEKVTYGSPLRGVTNTARGINGGQGIPAPSLKDFTMFGIRATSVKVSEFERSEHGQVDIKYLDGPVVFTFAVQTNADGSHNISADIINGSSLPLPIHGIDFEIEPGVTASKPLVWERIPSLTVQPGQDKHFELSNVEIALPQSYLNIPKKPRLIINNANVSPSINQFWDGLRSAQALSGPFTLLESSGVMNESLCPDSFPNGSLFNPEQYSRSGFAMSESSNESASCFYTAKDASRTSELLISWRNKPASHENAYLPCSGIEDQTFFYKNLRAAYSQVRYITANWRGFFTNEKAIETAVRQALTNLVDNKIGAKCP